jgi:hypothetical protein
LGGLGKRRRKAVNPRLIHRFVLGVVSLGTLVLLVPTLALAGVRPDDRSGPIGAVPATPRPIASDDVFMRAVSRHATSSASPARPDDRSGPLGAEPTTVVSHTSSVSAPTTLGSSDAFQWRDAAIGAAGALSVFMLLLATVTLQRQHRRSAVAH